MLPRTFAQRAARLVLTNTPKRITPLTTSLKPTATATLHNLQPSIRLASHIHQPPLRHASTTTPSGPSEADARIEEITELYATAQDEWEIAMEETEKNTTYAEDDRAAAREELDKVLQAYRAVVDGEDRELAEEVRRRIGQRVRELEMGVVRMEEMALEHD